MPPDTHRIDIKAWIDRVHADPVARRQRQATEIALHAIARLQDWPLYLKGGVLMGLVHHSPRQTTDIDLSAGFNFEAGLDEQIRELLIYSGRRATYSVNNSLMLLPCRAA